MPDVPRLRPDYDPETLTVPGVRPKDVRRVPGELLAQRARRPMPQVRGRQPDKGDSAIMFTSEPVTSFETKECFECGLPQPINLFRRNNKARGGRLNTCEPCRQKLNGPRTPIGANGRAPAQSPRLRPRPELTAAEIVQAAIDALEVVATGRPDRCHHAPPTLGSDGQRTYAANCLAALVSEPRIADLACAKTINRLRLVL